MKTLIIILIIATFLQTTILPVDLVLLILICRAYIKSGRSNLYLGFAFGLLTAHLNLNFLGIQSLICLSFVQITQMLSKIRLAGNPLLIVPITLVFLSLNRIINSLLSHTTWEFSGVILTAFLSLPTLYLIRFWEERFIVRKGIKLKI
ncbi:hypothetical protein A3J19_05090 [Candidatus Daviesbacteria bacterium RIFCSPLOWO2_02_FULL_41_8]|uniref:Rod shape-determining protein MreD n=1 Tax=Candidatus Daviesbacteria bacterium RIFCSPLOWO2_02_FULL_41_8 TaxID=1797798 RepID=A0A1F5NJ51_9BACT|nr:MAG: hypothetical protein A3J19_05090 [Candidatus Daviesbacteria bacterium RIFCSPLOWO2_02_FULL_41_8]